MPGSTGGHQILGRQDGGAQPRVGPRVVGRAAQSPGEVEGHAHEAREELKGHRWVAGRPLPERLWRRTGRGKGGQEATAA